VSLESKLDLLLGSLTQLETRLSALESKPSVESVKVESAPTVSIEGMSQSEIRDYAVKHGLQVNPRGSIGSKYLPAIKAHMANGTVLPSATRPAPAAVNAAAGTSPWGGTFSVGAGTKGSNQSAAQQLVSNPFKAMALSINPKGWRVLSLMGKNGNDNPANLLGKDRAIAFKMQSYAQYSSQGGGQSLLLEACRIAQMLQAANVQVSDLNRFGESRF